LFRWCIILLSLASSLAGVDKRHAFLAMLLLLKRRKQQFDVLFTCRMM
jgi:hypothetical protein